jgi:3-deoxy-D-manno-octulosonic-acid transferase
MLNQDSAIEAFSFRVVRNRCHDEFERRVDECSRLAAAARNDGDRAFWLGLVERWRAVESKHPILVPRRPARLRSITLE